MGDTNKIMFENYNILILLYGLSLNQEIYDEKRIIRFWKSNSSLF